MKNKLEIYCDGGSRGNPGPAASAFVVIKDGKELHEESIFLGTTTNNIAEYRAVILALEWLKKNDDKVIVDFFLDSQLVVRQLSGQYKVRSEKLIGYHDKIKSLEKSLQANINYSFVYRNKNVISDSLVNRELDRNK